MTKIFYYPSTDTQFDTVAKVNDIVNWLRQQGHGEVLQEVEQMLPQMLEDFMSTQYVRALQRGMPRMLAESSGLQWSPAYRASIFGMAQAMMAATWHAINTGEDTFALTAGAHHARPTAGAGFCAINSLAIAALSVVRNTDRQVYILDVDSHAGGGTNAFLNAEDNDRLHHMDVVVSSFDRYRGNRPQDICVMVTPTPAVPAQEAYLLQLATVLGFTDLNVPPRPGDVLLVNAGVDVHEDSDIGAMEGLDERFIMKREHYIREWAKQRGMVVVGLLAGGYSGQHLSPERLARVHGHSIYGLTGLRSLI